MWKLFTTHPEEAGETYWQHMGFAAVTGGRLVLAGLAALAHAVFPFVLKTTASRLTRDIYQAIEAKKAEAKEPVPEQGPVRNLQEPTP